MRKLATEYKRINALNCWYSPCNYDKTMQKKYMTRSDKISLIARQNLT